MQRVDAAKQDLVHEDPVPMLGLEWRHLAFDCKDRIIGMGAGQELENIARAGERLSACFQSGDGVGEGGRGGIAGDGRDLGGMRGKCTRKGGPEMFRLDPAEGGHAVRTAPLLEQWIVVSLRGEDLGLLAHAASYGDVNGNVKRLHCTLKQGAGRKHASMDASLNFSDVKYAPRCPSNRRALCVALSEQDPCFYPARNLLRVWKSLNVFSGTPKFVASRRGGLAPIQSASEMDS